MVRQTHENCQNPRKAEKQLLASIIFYDGNQSETHKLGPICCEPDFCPSRMSTSILAAPMTCVHRQHAKIRLVFFLLSALSDPREIFHVFFAIASSFVVVCASASKIKMENDGEKFSRVNFSWRFLVTPHSHGVNNRARLALYRLGPVLGRISCVGWFIAEAILMESFEQQFVCISPGTFIAFFFFSRLLLA
jgi:hypothetical protein